MKKCVKRNLHNALWASIKVGVVASVVSTTIALFAAKAFARYKFRGQNISYGAIMMPFLIPEIILAVSILIIWLSLGFKLGLVPVTIGHILFCTPFAMLILIARIEGFDFSLEEASRDLGENAWGTFYRVSLPLYLPGIIASLLLSFIISFDEFVLAFFLTGSDATLPMYMGSNEVYSEITTCFRTWSCYNCIYYFYSFASILVEEPWTRKRKDRVWNKYT